MNKIGNLREALHKKSPIDGYSKLLRRLEVGFTEPGTKRLAGHATLHIRSEVTGCNHSIL